MRTHSHKVHARSAIPQFALYGETANTHKPDFVHIEDIHERSSRNGWEIKPHRHAHLFQILCMFSGKVEVRLDERNLVHEGACVMTMPVGVVHGFRFRPDTQGVVLSLAINMLGLDAENQLGTLLEGVLGQPHILKLQKNMLLFQSLSQYLALIRQEQSVPGEDQQLSLFALVKLVLVNLKRGLQAQQLNASSSENGVPLANKFRSLLEQHYKDHWSISAYADALHVSVSTLNRSCQQVLGSTAKKMLQGRLHMEAKRRLIYTRETLDQICFDLGFKDAAYFSRVFKQLEGISPKHFRKTLPAA